ncbi:MAG: DNA translocase FtsK 4TM domain-containing protein, partial [Gammaproteobacteria bacterium]
MAQARRKKQDRIPLTLHVARGLREGIFLVLFTLAVYLLISLFTYHSGDPGWSLSDSGGELGNRGGVAGAWFADVFLYLFGYPAYLFPIMVGYSGWLVFHGRMAGEGVDAHVLILRWSGFVVTVVAACGLAALHYDIPPDRLPLNAGGILGDVVYGTLVSAFSFLGATLFLLALFFAGITVFTGLSWLAVTDHIGRITLQLVSYLRQLLRKAWDTAEGYRVRQEREEVVKAEQERIIRRKPVRVEPIMPTATVGERVERERQVPLFEPPPDTELPPLALLDEPPPRQAGYSNESLEAMSRLVELKLADFGVEVEVVAVHPGPVVTRFELQPGAGVKVSQITNLAKDLARALSTLSVRVVEIIPGKPVVGLEIPNEYRELVALSEILRSAEYDQARSPLTLALGKDIGGHPVVADLTRMPHLLVAGTTGSGKSVAINGMVLSLLYKTLPTDVRLIMIDPKMLELSVYEGIPHLLTPVVTDMREAATALRWCVGEMERRYRLMAALGVRNIAGYNRKVKQAIDSGQPIPDPMFKADDAADSSDSPPELQPLPFIVVIVDELADMMMVVGKKVEQLIARLAQKARAAGIHLILATQRPSVDVITGLIKA